jgi:malate dehydrogenase
MSGEGSSSHRHRAAGQIAIPLLPDRPRRHVGEDQPIVLRLLEIEPAMKALEGVAMELDGAFPMVVGMQLTHKPEEALEGANWILLVGAAPRKQGMERKDLLSVNGTIFGPQGKAIAKKAASDVRILVVGNPCNTNAYIARMNAPEIAPERWFAMTRLDENRARTQLAQKAKVPVAALSNVGIWGNHSTTQYPDALTRGSGPSVFDVISTSWPAGKPETIQKRGAAVIEARGASSRIRGERRRRLGGQHPHATPGRLAPRSRDGHGEYGVPEWLHSVSGRRTASSGRSCRPKARRRRVEAHPRDDAGAPARAGDGQGWSQLEIRSGREARDGYLSPFRSAPRWG